MGKDPAPDQRARIRASFNSGYTSFSSEREVPASYGNRAGSAIADGGFLMARRVDGRLVPAGKPDRTICLDWKMDQRPEAVARRVIRVRAIATDTRSGHGWIHGLLAF